MINNTSYQTHIPQDFANDSKIWIYQANRIFTMNEVFEIEPMLEAFIASWQSHGVAVKGYANLFYGQFIVVMADESNCKVGGCSTDSSVHLIKKMEQTFKVEMFNRQSLAFIVKDKIQVLPLSQINYAIENNFINAETLYFNNLVATKTELMSHWIVPVAESWLAPKVLASN